MQKLSFFVIIYTGDFMTFKGRSKFKERKYSYIRKKETENEEEEKILPKVGKIVLYSPLLLLGVVGKIIDKNSAKKDINTKKFKEQHSSKQENNSKTKKDNININNKKITIVPTKNNFSLKENTNYISNNSPKSMEISIKEESNQVKEIKKLEQKIFLKLSKKINFLENECQEVQSKEYMLNKYSSDKQIYDEAIKIKQEVEALIKKVQEINETYSILKDNELIKDPSSLNDSLLIEDIIKYRDMITNSEYDNIPKKIRLLNAYENINDLVEKLKIKTDNYYSIKTKRAKQLSNRDKKYNQYKKKTLNIKEINHKYDQSIKEYNEYQKELLNKINNIDIKTYTEYKLKGMDNFLSTTCRYLGLMALFPLRGIIPRIAMETKNTRKALNTMLDNIHYEKVERKTYEVGNYLNEIDNKIYSIKNVKTDLTKALFEVSKLKEEFKDEFLKYNLDEYDIAYKKILQIEKNIFQNKNRLEEITKGLEDKKKIDVEVLKKVKKLNS